MPKSNNPIPYSALISPDNSITDLISQLERLNRTYEQTAASIQANARNIATGLGRVSSATEEGREETRRAAQQTDALQRAQNNLNNATGENARRIAELNQARREANQINRLQVRLNSSAEGSYNRLSAQYSLNRIRLNAMSQAQREATEEGRRLERETHDLRDEMMRLQAATGNMTLNVGNYTESIQRALGVNNQFGQSILELGNRATRQQAFTALTDGAKAFGKTLLGLLKNPAFLALAGVAGAGAGLKLFYNYNKGLQIATRLTQQFTDKQGANLRKFRTDVQAVADTFGKDFQETLLATNALARQFGITFEESLNLIKDGFIVGGDLNGEFLDTIKEYPAYFKEAGLSAEDFVAITAQAAKAGIFSDKAIDTIKEGNLRLREMTKATRDALTGIGISADEVQKRLREGSITTFEVMQMVSEKLSELPDSASEVGTAIADIFGGPGEDAGLQYLRTLKDISLSLDEVKGKAGTLAKLQEEQLESQMELERSLSALFDFTGGSFEEMTAEIKIFTNRTLVKLINRIIELTNYFVNLYNDSENFRALWNAVVESFKIGLDTIANLSKSFFDIWEAGSKVVIGTLTFDFDTIKEGVKGVGLAIKNLAENEIKDVTDDFLEGVENLKKRIDPIVIPVEFEASGTAPGVSSGGKSKSSQAASGGKSSGGTSSKIGSVEKATQDFSESKDVYDYASSLSEGYDERNIKASEDAMKRMADDYRQMRKNQREADEEYLEKKKENEENAKEVAQMAADATLDVLAQVAEARLAAADAAVEQAEKEVDSAQRALDAEKEARANGYASNVAMAQKELEFARRNEEKALKEQKKAQKQQAAVQTLQQIGDLVTASAKIWGQMGFPWAIPAIATMWTSFAASKIIAAKMAKDATTEKYANGTVELLEGGSHASGHDIDLGRKKDGTRRRAEGGEFFAVINRRNSKRFRNEIPKVINSLNDGTFANKYLSAYDGASGLNVTVNEDNQGMRELTADVREIRRQGARKTYYDAQGNTIEEYRNVKRIIRR